MAKKIKKKTIKSRNPYIIAMTKKAKAGPMKDKRDKRKSGKNKQTSILDEATNE